MGRVKRHVAGAGLEDRQQPRQGVKATPGQDCDTVIGLYAERH